MKSQLNKYKYFFVYWIFSVNLILYTSNLFFDSTLIFDMILGISALITFVFLIFCRINKLLVKEESLTLIIFSLALCLCFQSIILNVDRSRSFYVLSWINQGKVLVKNDGDYYLSGVVSSERESLDAIKQRLVEQRDRGLIEIKGDRVVLTKLGTFFYISAEKLAYLYDLKGWKLNRN